ncbi:MAG: peptidoglycan-binding protein [Polyangiaceae bacterium]
MTDNTVHALSARFVMASEWKAYRVRQGDHVRRLAFRAGVSPDEVWNHQKNKDLKAKRECMDILAPGDILYLPTEPPAGADITHGTTNRYQCQIPTIHVSFQLAGDDRYKNKAYKATVAGTVGDPLEGSTGDKGEVDLVVPVIATQVDFKIEELSFEAILEVGALDPVGEDSGVVQRLRSLGYLPDEKAPVSRREVEAATAQFQKDQGLSATGFITDELRKKLDEAHSAKSKRKAEQ